MATYNDEDDAVKLWKKMTCQSLWSQSFILLIIQGLFAPVEITLKKAVE